MSIPTKIDIALTNNTINYELMPISIVDLFLQIDQSKFNKFYSRLYFSFTSFYVKKLNI